MTPLRIAHKKWHFFLSIFHFLLMMWKMRDWEAEKRGEGGKPEGSLTVLCKEEKKTNIPVSFKRETCLWPINELLRKAHAWLLYLVFLVRKFVLRHTILKFSPPLCQKRLEHSKLMTRQSHTPGTGFSTENSLHLSHLFFFFFLIAGSISFSRKWAFLQDVGNRGSSNLYILKKWLS